MISCFFFSFFLWTLTVTSQQNNKNFIFPIGTFGKFSKIPFIEQQMIKKNEQIISFSNRMQNIITKRAKVKIKRNKFIFVSCLVLSGFVSCPLITIIRVVDIDVDAVTVIITIVWIPKCLIYQSKTNNNKKKK